VRIGTRASPLARAQTQLITAELKARYPALEVTLVPITTSGDRSQHTNAPGGDWGSGVFVKELEQALLNGVIDLAVHSLKDVPPQLTPGLDHVAIPAREDPRDALLTVDARSLDELAPAARVGTSSSRRVAFLRAARPDLEFLPIRGNVDTRMRKLQAGEYDAVVLARAGLRRLGAVLPHVVLEPDVLPPAPGQGALALEARADDRDVVRLVETLNDHVTALVVRAERRVMLHLEGGCRLPIGALGTPGPDGTLSLLGAVASPDGRHVLRERLDGRLEDAEAVADQLADRLLAARAAA
jgi:hydroxymethylbilane synthase